MNANTKGLRGFLSRYGAMFVLALTICAMGISYAVLGKKPQEPELLPQTTNAPAPAPIRTAQPQPAATVKPVLTAPTEEPSQETGLFTPDLHWIAPVQGKVQRVFAMDRLIYQPTLAEYSTHAGMDLACVEGQEVQAAADGTVSRVYSDPLMGNCIEISHADGYVSLYANMDTAQVEAGQKVSQGEVLGTAGTSAKAEFAQGCHLHFEVKKDGVAVDPETLFR